MRKHFAIYTLGVWALALCLVAAMAGGARAAQPLLIPGKTTLYQKVITHPAAKVYASPSTSSNVVVADLKAFSQMYVYERRGIDGDKWLKVGYSTNGTTLGWLRDDKASQWNQALTLKFSERTGRDPVVFFRSQDSLRDTLGQPDIAASLAALRTEFGRLKAAQQGPLASFPAVAMEPSSTAVPHKRFYIIPIFQVQQVAGGGNVKLCQVASIDPGNTQQPAPGENRSADRGFKCGICFVMDTTISMQPYIDRAKQLVRDIYDHVVAEGLSDKVAFALVGYRGRLEGNPGVEYCTKVISGFKTADKRQEFEEALRKTVEANVSTASFSEDAYAGIMAAAQQLNWEPFQGRIIYLITDAGSLEGHASASGLKSEQLRQRLKEENIKAFVLHLKTPAGEKAGNTAPAERQYRAMTHNNDPNIRDLYVGMPADTAAKGSSKFANETKWISTQFVETVKNRLLGFPPRRVDSQGPNQAQSEAARKAALLGYAMELDYLGKRQGTRAPRVVISWITDKDPISNAPSFDVCVLMTKDQLNDLAARLEKVIKLARDDVTTGNRDFFSSILSASAGLINDPRRFQDDPSRNLLKMGVLGEYLNDLPYKGTDFLRMTAERWHELPRDRQMKILGNLNSKLNSYRLYDRDVANWISFSPACPPGEKVYRIPLSELP